MSFLQMQCRGCCPTARGLMPAARKAKRVSVTCNQWEKVSQLRSDQEPPSITPDITPQRSQRGTHTTAAHCLFSPCNSFFFTTAAGVGHNSTPGGLGRSITQTCCLQDHQMPGLEEWRCAIRHCCCILAVLNVRTNLFCMNVKIKVKLPTPPPTHFPLISSLTTNEDGTVQLHSTLDDVAISQRCNSMR